MRVSGIMPWNRWRSEPQTAARVTRTMASFGCWIVGLGFSSTRILYGPRYAMALTGPPPPDSGLPSRRGRSGSGSHRGDHWLLLDRDGARPAGNRFGWTIEANQ